MSTRTLPLLFLITGILSTAAPAQVLGSAECSPNPAPVGSTISISIEASAQSSLLSGCAISEIRQGSPTGPVVYSPFICPFILIQVAPGFPYTRHWDGNDQSGNPVPAGTYYIRVDFGDPNGGNYVPQFFPVRIDDPAGPALPVLATGNAAARGQALDLQISNGDPSATYVMAASLGTSTGITWPGVGHVALDLDPVFALSYPANPALFPGFVGVLDGTGSSSLPAAMIPNDPALQGVPLAFQGVVLGMSTQLTNPITRSIQ